VAKQLVRAVEQMNDHAGVYDTAVTDVYRDDEYPYTFAVGRERNAYTSRTTERSMTRRLAMLMVFPVLLLAAASCANKSQPTKTSGRRKRRIRFALPSRRAVDRSWSK
jgi:hypothetical protein